MLVQDIDMPSPKFEVPQTLSTSMPPAPYTISIRNKSSVKQSYAIFAEPPVIKSSSPDEVLVTTYIISVGHGVAPGAGEATFILSKSLYATCGTYDVEFEENSQFDKGHATGTEIIDQRPVILGQQDAGDVLIRGTTLQVEVSDGCPIFSKKNPDRTGKLDCFAMITREDFKVSEAKMNKFALGYSSSLRHSVGAYAMWTPSPSQVYQVKPSQVFYVIAGSYNTGDLINVKSVKEQPGFCMVDFEEVRKDLVQLAHDDRNVIRISISADN